MELKNWYMDTQTVPYQPDVLLGWGGGGGGGGGNCLLVFQK